jgi:polyisoprenoid-binding protein YceI
MLATVSSSKQLRFKLWARRLSPFPVSGRPTVHQHSGESRRRKGGSLRHPVLCLLLLSAYSWLHLPPAYAQQTKWTQDNQHSKAIFRVSHDNIGLVTGWFSRLFSSVRYDGKDLTKASVSATVFVDSLNTGTEFRDQHLKSDHFFDLAKFPDMTFKSTKIVPSGSGKFKMTGDLKIKGKTKSVTFDCVGPKGPVTGDNERVRIGVVASTRLKIKDFDFNWNREVSPGVFMVGDDVEITLEMEFLKAERSKKP